MAKAKDSFLLYYELEDQVSDLSDSQLGALFRAIFAYERRGEAYSGEDMAVRMAMRFVQSVLDRNRERWDERPNAAARTEKKGGAPQNQRKASDRPIRKPKKPSRFFQNPENLFLYVYLYLYVFLYVRVRGLRPPPARAMKKTQARNHRKSNGRTT